MVDATENAARGLRMELSFKDSPNSQRQHANYENSVQI